MPSCKETKKFRLNDLVVFKDNADRVELDGDGVYIVIGLQSGVRLHTGFRQEEKITLLCDNGVVRTSAEKIERLKSIEEKDALAHPAIEKHVVRQVVECEN